MENISRRALLESAMKGSVLALSFALPTGSLLMTPAEARVKGVPLRALSAKTAQDLDKLGETILPGATAAGLTHFIDHQVAADPNEALLIARYFQVAPPYADFYAAGARIADEMALRTAGKTIAGSSAAEMQTLVKSLSAPGGVVDGFPIFLFYLCLRSDAVDVVYGTPEGFKKLNIPYMQHILPPEGWNG